MKISIIIPLYNKERYVRRCLESVLGQTYKDFEAIVVNDGSTDKSLEIASTFQDDRLRILDVPNGGVSRARNLGLDAAKGDYVLFVDADDWIEQDYLHNLLHDATGQDFDLMIFGITRVFQDGKTVRVEMPQCSQEDFYRRFMSIQNVEARGITGFVCNKLIRRDFLGTNSLRFNPNIKLAEDVFFYQEVFECNPRIITSRECGYNYLQEADNSSFFQKDVDFFALISVWVKCFRMLEKKGVAKENQQMLFRDIFGLFSAHFNESMNLSFSNVRFDLTRLLAIGDDLPGFWENVAPTGALSSAIYHRSSFLVFVYLKWRFVYHCMLGRNARILMGKLRQ